MFSYTGGYHGWLRDVIARSIKLAAPAASGGADKKLNRSSCLVFV
jgi:hypothetical protein